MVEGEVPEMLVPEVEVPGDVRDAAESALFLKESLSGLGPFAEFLESMPLSPEICCQLVVDLLGLCFISGLGAAADGFSVGRNFDPPVGAVGSLIECHVLFLA